MNHKLNVVRTKVLNEAGVEMPALALLFEDSVWQESADFHSFLEEVEVRSLSDDFGKVIHDRWVHINAALRAAEFVLQTSVAAMIKPTSDQRLMKFVQWRDDLTFQVSVGYYLDSIKGSLSLSKDDVVSLDIIDRFGTLSREDYLGLVNPETAPDDGAKVGIPHLK